MKKKYSFSTAATLIASFAIVLNLTCCGNDSGSSKSLFCSDACTRIFGECKSEIEASWDESVDNVFGSESECVEGCNRDYSQAKSLCYNCKKVSCAEMGICLLKNCPLGGGSDKAGADGDAGAVGGQSETGGSGGTNGGGSSASPLFEQYNPPGGGLRHKDITWSNSQIDGVTYYYYVKNTGGSGSVTVTINYQGQTETKRFTVDAGVQYVLSSFHDVTSAAVYTCSLTIDLPGLTINEDMRGATTGTCVEISGPTASDLIPLSSCTCSGGCTTDVCFNNCGFADQTCCGGCATAGKSCNAGFCE